MNGVGLSTEINFIPEEIEIDDCAVTEESVAASNEQFAEFTSVVSTTLLARAAQIQTIEAAVFFMGKSFQIIFKLII
jgi:hypothetical protein